MNPNGIFALWAAREGRGLDETDDIRNLPPTLQEMLNAWKGRAYRVLCRSEYPYNRWEKEGLEKLCTTEGGRASVIDPSLFEHTMTKTDNSILAASEEDLKFLHRNEYLILAGVTTTSCIRKSIEQLLAERTQLKIIVFRNLVAARKSERDKAEKVLNMRHPNLTVMDRWQDAEVAEA